MAAKGAISPNSAKRMASTVEILSVFQPCSFDSGTSNAPGSPSAAAVVSMTRKPSAATIQA